VVAALVRRGDELLMVRQAAPGEEPYWSTPGGQVDDGELVTEALARELLEETGIRVVDPGMVAFVVQTDDRRPVQLHEATGAGRGYHVTVWTFDVAGWEGEVASADPDALVHEAAFVPLADAVAHLERIEWQSLTVRYLRDEIPAGSLWLRRRHADGRAETVARLP
jgi:8-oxo-dGTP diphosphatase